MGKVAIKDAAGTFGKRWVIDCPQRVVGEGDINIKAQSSLVWWPEAISDNVLVMTDACSGLQGHRIKTSQRLSKETITTIHRHWVSNSTDLGKPSVKGQIITVLGFVVIMSWSQLSLAMTCNKFRAQKWISMALCQSTLFTEAGGGLDLANRSIGKESACNAGDLSSIPGLGISPGGGCGNPLQYSGLEKPHGQRSLVGYTSWGRKRVGRKNKKRGTKDSTAQVPIT